ncbi:MAG TPA: hypothetical protein VMA31_11075 [Bryobacteraceae bacterium]|nr:hypothetical protein [Bryobacteraceae bacterium]
MKTAFAFLLSFAATLFAADTKTPNDSGTNPPTQSEEVRRLKSITWDLNSHQLVWVVQKGTMANGNFVMGSEQQYAITPDNAAMAFSGEQRGFDNEEAASLQHLLDVLSVYCAESVVWWEEGQGKPAPGHNSDKPKSDTDGAPNGKPVKVDQPEQQKKPAYKKPDADFIAAAAH